MYKNHGSDPTRGKNNLKTVIALWTASYLPNDKRMCIFKSTSNTLGIGSRVQHINPDIDPSCTFCKKCKRLPAPLETDTHIFYHCPTTYQIITEYANRYVAADLTMENLFLGVDNVTVFDNKMLVLVYFVLRYQYYGLIPRHI